MILSYTLENQFHIEFFYMNYHLEVSQSIWIETFLERVEELYTVDDYNSYEQYLFSDFNAFDLV